MCQSSQDFCNLVFLYVINQESLLNNYQIVGSDCDEGSFSRQIHVKFVLQVDETIVPDHNENNIINFLFSVNLFIQCIFFLEIIAREFCISSWCHFFFWSILSYKFYNDMGMFHY